MSLRSFEKSTGYWVDQHANIIPIPPGQEHIGVARQKLGDKNPYHQKWIRVASDPEYGIMYDYAEKPSPQQGMALRDIADEHGLPLFDTIRRVVVEYRRSSVKSLLASAIVDSLLQ